MRALQATARIPRIRTRRRLTHKTDDRFTTAAAETRAHRNRRDGTHTRRPRLGRASVCFQAYPVRGGGGSGPTVL